MRNTGIALTAVACAHVVAGLAMFLAAADHTEDLEGSYDHNAVMNMSGGILLGVGGLLGLIGIPMLVSGSRPPDAPPATAGDGPPAGRAAWVPEVRRTGLRWTF